MSERLFEQLVPDFLIVGTSHSGTTLVQRLACELPGVRMPPETHFFETFAPELSRRRRFPLHGRALREELQAFSALRTSTGMDLDVDATADVLGGTCPSLLALFGAIVRVLAGPGDVFGEKTPMHLLWWSEITQVAPMMKLIAVVRDPRAVVFSQLDDSQPWRRSPHVVWASRWAADQRQVARAESELTAERCLVLRYEDVVRAPGKARSTIASLLGVVPEDGRSARAPASFILPWETGKGRALEPVTTERVERWRHGLPKEQADDVEHVCGDQMERFGYVADRPHRSHVPAGRRGLDYVLSRCRFQAIRSREHLRKKATLYRAPLGSAP